MKAAERGGTRQTDDKPRLRRKTRTPGCTALFGDFRRPDAAWSRRRRVVRRTSYAPRAVSRWRQGPSEPRAHSPRSRRPARPATLGVTGSPPRARRPSPPTASLSIRPAASATPSWRIAHRDASPRPARGGTLGASGLGPGRHDRTDQVTSMRAGGGPPRPSVGSPMTRPRNRAPSTDRKTTYRIAHQTASPAKPRRPPTPRWSRPALRARTRIDADAGWPGGRPAFVGSAFDSPVS